MNLDLNRLVAETLYPGGQETKANQITLLDNEIQIVKGLRYKN